MFCGVGGFRLGLERCNQIVGYQAEREDKKAQNSTDLNERQQAGRHATVDSGGFLQGEGAAEIQDSPRPKKRQDRAEGLRHLQPKNEEGRNSGDSTTELHKGKQKRRTER